MVKHRWGYKACISVVRSVAEAKEASSSDKMDEPSDRRVTGYITADSPSTHPR